MAYKNIEKRRKAWRDNYNKNSSFKRIRIKERSKIYRAKNRAFVLLYLSKKGCCECGENDISVLEFDHINPSEKLADISVMVRSVGLDKLEKEISKCRVMCCNCHRRYTKKQQNFIKPELSKEDMVTIAQLVERLVVAEEAAGSNPVRHPILYV